MRTHSPGIRREQAPFCFDFEGEQISAHAGESIAAALLAAEQPHCRLTRENAPRGLFCGMGVCGECTVLVDGNARRACLEKAQPGLEVRRHPGRSEALQPGTAEVAAPPPVRQWEQRQTDVLVIGAGPAGLAAAIAAARAGAQVTVVDERAQAGGQYFKQPGAGFALRDSQLDAQFREGRELYQQARTAGVQFIYEATVWGAFSVAEVAVLTPAACLMFCARRLVLCPGAYERALPFPGWTLPGIMTTGAAQTLLRAYQTSPGQRVLVAGNGPLNLQVARELSDAGVQVVAVAELARAPGPRLAGPLARMALNAPALVRDGLAHLGTLWRRRVPVLHRHIVCRAEGEARVQRVSLIPLNAAGQPLPNRERHFAVDAVCLGYGFQPQSELARSLGCLHEFDPRSGQLQIVRDQNTRSTVAEVFVPGDAGGLGGARVAIAQGTLAGAAAATDLGFARTAGHAVLAADPAQPRGADRHDQSAELRRAERQLRRHQRFQTALWQVYAAPAPLTTLATAMCDADTLICRCESVSRARVDACLAAGVSDIGALKRETRAGMGRCQGRYCGALLHSLAQQAGLAASGEAALFAPRTPFKPVAIGELATAYDDSRPPDREAEAR